MAIFSTATRDSSDMRLPRASRTMSRFGSFRTYDYVYVYVYIYIYITRSGPIHIYIYIYTCTIISINRIHSIMDQGAVPIVHADVQDPVHVEEDHGVDRLYNNSNSNSTSNNNDNNNKKQ